MPAELVGYRFKMLRVIHVKKCSRSEFMARSVEESGIRVYIAGSRRAPSAFVAQNNSD